jgi:hypothetical protein
MKKALFILLCVLPLISKGQKPDASYTFNSTMVYEMINKDKKGKTTTLEQEYYFGNKEGVVGAKMKMGDKGPGIDFMIMDLANLRVFTFLNSKIMMGMNFKEDKVVQTIEKENSKFSITKTGESRTILNEVCEGYKVVKEGEKSDDVTMWISKNKVEAIAKLAGSMAKAYGRGFGGKQPNYFAYNAHPELVKMAKEGRAILGYTVKGDKGDITEMLLKDSKTNINFTFNTTEYKSMF